MNNSKSAHRNSAKSPRLCRGGSGRRRGAQRGPTRPSPRTAPCNRWVVCRLGEVERWYLTLSPEAMDAVTGAIDLLERHGPALRRPTVGKMSGSKFHKLKELRPAGTSIRILLIFDSRRRAILLLGGDKAGNWDRWYDDNIPLAERHYEEWLATKRDV